MQKILKRILMILGIMLISIICEASMSKVNAEYFNMSDIESGENYCIEQKGKLTNQRRLYYTLVNHITIEGRKATNQNGKTVDSYDNAKLAYILAGGNGAFGTGSLANSAGTGETTRQITVWDYVNEWQSNSGSQLGVSYDQSQNGGLSVSQAQANAVANFEGEADNTARGTAGISAITTSANVENGAAGPIQVKYIGSIASIKVLDANGADVTGQVSIDIPVVGGNERDGWLVNFWIAKKNNDVQLSKLVVELQPQTTLKVDLYFWHTDEMLYGSNTGWGKAQDFIQVQRSTVTHTPRVEIALNDAGGNEITIKKVLEDTGKGAIAGFVIRNNTKGRYLSGSSSFTYLSNTRQIWRTDSSGNLSISKVPEGSYTVQEVEIPEGYEGAPSQTKSISRNKGAIFEFKNKKKIKTSSSIKVKKLDSDGSSTPISGIKFELYRYEYDTYYHYKQYYDSYYGGEATGAEDKYVMSKPSNSSIYDTCRECDGDGGWNCTVCDENHKISCNTCSRNWRNKW